MNFGALIEKQKRLTLCAMILFVVAGVLSWRAMPKQEDPSLPDRFGSVVIQFPGADAQTVERLVVIPMERELQSVAEIKTIEATSRADVAIFSLELNETIYAVDAAWKRVEDAIDAGERELPAEAGTPETSWEGIELQSVTLAITGSGDWLALKEAAEHVEDRLYRLPGVRRVVMTPELDEQITVLLPEEALRQLNMSSRQLAGLLSTRTAIVPGGHIAVQGIRIPVDTGSDIESVEELSTTQLPVSVDSSLPLSALGEVRRGRAEPIGELVRFNGQQAIIVGAVPKDNIDVIAFGNQVRELLPDIEAHIAPLQLTPMTFQPDRVRSRLGGLQFSLVQGVLIVAAVLVLSMGLRLGLTVAVMIPTVALASLTVYAAFGGVLQQMSIAALVMSLGLLVDNAIVVSERIQWWIDSGKSRTAAAATAVREMAMPLVAATGTTLAAFLPLLLSRGATADFTSAIPRLVMLSIGVSLLFALTVTPTLGILVFRPSSRGGEHVMVRWARRISTVPANRPVLVVVGLFVAVVGAFSLAPLVGQQFFPSGDRNQLVLDIELPEGTHLLQTNDVATHLEQAVSNREDVVSVATFVGRSAPAFYYNIIPETNAPHHAQLLITTRDVSDVEKTIAWSRTFARHELPGVIVIPRRLEQGPPVSAPVEIRLYADSLAALQEATLSTLKVVQESSGTEDVYHDLSLGALNLAYRIDDAAANRSGVGRDEVVSTLLGMTRGLPAGEIRFEDEGVPVIVRSPKGEFTPVNRLETAEVWSQTGRIVPIGAISRTATELRPAAIRRRNGSRIAGVYSQLSGGAAYNQVLDQVVPRLDLPDGARFQIGGAAEGSGEANQAIVGAAYVGVAVLLFILIAQFRSFRKVGIILVTVPLSAVGIIPGLLIGGQAFGFMSMLGVIALVGIVVNNAIILIDVIDARLTTGHGLKDSVRLAVEERARPIVLTAVTTIAGLLPLLYSSSSLWPPFASALISGLAASTALTLFAVPALYMLLFRKLEKPPRGPALRTMGRLGPALFVLMTLTPLALPATTEAQEAKASEVLSLHRVIEMAASNPGVRASMSAAEAAGDNSQAVFRESFFPTLFVEGELLRRSQEITSEFSLGALGSQKVTQLPDWEGTVSAGFRQQLLDLRSQYGELSAARAAEDAVRNQSLRALQTAEYHAAAAALRIGAVEAGIDAAEASEVSLAAEYRRVGTLVEAGRALTSDLLQLEIALLEVRRDLAAMERQLTLAKNDLGRILGRPGAVEPRIPVVSGETVRRAAASVTPDSAGRPDVQSLTATARELDLRRRSVLAGTLPEVALTVQSVSTVNNGIQPEQWFQGGITFTWTPVASGVRGSRRSELKARREEVAARSDELRLNARLAFQQAEFALQDALDDLAVQEIAVANQERVVSEVSLQYEAGRRSVSDLLDAEAKVRRARTAFVQARLEALRTLFLLQYEAGARITLPG